MEKVIPYKSTFLTLSNYKEPLLEIPKEEGFGYYGTILNTVDSKYLQCHICGELFKDMGAHSRQAHKISDREYKIKFRLARGTVLISENEREIKKNRYIEMFGNLTGEEKTNLLIKNHKKVIDYWKKVKSGEIERKAHPGGDSLEKQNKLGICPDQLINKIKIITEEIGHTPSLVEINNHTGTYRWEDLIYKHFGNYENALKMANLAPREKITRGIDGKGWFKKAYTKEELIEYLIIFTRENQKIPTRTDFDRGLLPPYQTYYRRFGSIETARQEANVYELIS